MGLYSYIDPFQGLRGRKSWRPRDCAQFFDLTGRFGGVFFVRLSRRGGGSPPATSSRTTQTDVAEVYPDSVALYDASNVWVANYGNGTAANFFADSNASKRVGYGASPVKMPLPLQSK